MHTNKSLNQYLKKISQRCVEFIDELQSDNKYKIDVQIPIFKKEQLADIRQIKSLEYSRIQFAIIKEKRWVNDPSLKIAKNILKNDTKLLRSKDPGDNPNDFASRQIALFVSQLTKDNGHKTIDAFRTTLSKFHNHLNRDSKYAIYITPLYNMKWSFSKIALSPNLYIREITDREYSKIVRLDRAVMKDIAQYQRRLKFVLVCRMTGTASKQLLQEAISTYVLVLNTLRLFKEGDAQFGRVYEIESESMDVGKIESLPSYYENPVACKEVFLSKTDVHKFELFYDKMIKTLKDPKKSEFLYNAINRFGMAYQHRTPTNKIIDYVIALESLLTDSPGESTLKLAHRTASIYANTDDERVDTWDFIRHVYNFRSGIIHSSKERRIKIQSSIMDVDIAESKLHTITKKSIQRMMSLLGTYKTQKNVLDILDRAIYNRKEMLKLRKKGSF